MKSIYAIIAGVLRRLGQESFDLNYEKKENDNYRGCLFGQGG